MRLAVVVGMGLAILVQPQTFAGPMPQPRTEIDAPTVTLIKDEEALARERIRAETRRLLEAKNYQALDALAVQMQRSGKTYARGQWEITFFFSEVSNPPKEATDAEWETHIQRVRDWFEQDPDSIFARITMAQALVGYAWRARGADWAHNVTDDGWHLMAERATEARRILVAAESLPHDCPVFYSTWMDVAQLEGISRESYDELFTNAVSAFPTYSCFYTIRAIHLLPRWYGKLGEWEALANHAADGVGGDEGDVLYARIVWRMHDARVYGNILSEAKVDWPRIQRGFETICRRYPSSISAPSEYCSISGFAPAGARKLMRSLFIPLRNRVDLSVWKSMDNFVRDYRWATSQ